MSYTVRKVAVWAGDVMNRPEKLARVLEALAGAGASLEFLVARRVSDTTSRVFVAPIESAAGQRAAVDVGLVPATSMHAIRIDGPDRAGLGADISRSVAASGINIRGASAASIGKSTAFWLAFKTPEECDAAAAVVKAKLASNQKSSAAKTPSKKKSAKKLAAKSKSKTARKPAAKKKKAAAAKPPKKKARKK